MISQYNSIHFLIDEYSFFMERKKQSKTKARENKFDEFEPIKPWHNWTMEQQQAQQCASA
jgi:hypothetical protein